MNEKTIHFHGLNKKQKRVVFVIYLFMMLDEMNYCVVFKYTVGGCLESRNEIKRGKRRLTEEDDPVTEMQKAIVFCVLLT